MTVSIGTKAFPLRLHLEATSPSIKPDLRRKRGSQSKCAILALANFELHLERVKARADAGGHSASEETLRGIHNASLRNLPRAIEETDEIWIYDNTKFGGPPLLVMEAKAGEIVGISNPCPAWLEGVMR